MKKFADRLIQWGIKKGRTNLPWKSKTNGSYDPYKIWVSEMMLQQTRLSAVLPKFNQFIRRFPDVESLANSTLEDVIRVWAGLGYYRRARNLHEGAKIIVNERGKIFPKNAVDWKTMPGIGTSTSAAISSFVFGEKVALLDANVYRVLCRRYCLENTNSKVKEKEQLMQLATNLLPKKKSEMAQYSQYIMDLGAIVCKATQPACNKCPVSGDCKSFKSEVVNLYPKKVKLTRREKQITWVLTMDRDLILLELQTKEELWKSLLVPATEVKMKGNFPLPQKNFFRSYRVKVSNCDLTVKVWRRNCIFDMLKITTHHRIVNKVRISKVAVPRLLETVLKDFDLWSYTS